MGKLSIKEADDLRKAGVIDEEALNEMRSQGLVGTKRRGSRRFLKNQKNGTKIYPTLYFSGLGKGTEYEKDMLEIKDKFQELIEPYTNTKE